MTLALGALFATAAAVSVASLTHSALELAAHWPAIRRAILSL